MDPIFTEEQLNRMSREDNLSLVKIMQGQYQKQETKIQLLEEKTKELEFLNAMLSDRLTLAQRKRFGASSEKYADGYTQLSLFNEAEQAADPNAPEPDLEEVHPASYRRKKHSGKKEEDLSSFETTEVIEYKLSGADRYCPNCHTKYKVVTKETVKRLKFVPARFEVVEEVTFVYSCPKCGAMKRPEKSPSLLKGSIVTPSLVAGIMNAKYVNGMPLARQEREFTRYDLNLSAKTMAYWIIQCANRYLQPLYNLMKEELLRSKYLHGDETRIQVIDEPDQKGSTPNWMWVYLTDEYSGSFTCDGYQVYHSLPDRITVTGCMAHARRRFDEALTVLKKDFTKEQLKETTAYQAMARIGLLYKIEEMIRDKSPKERYEERQKQAKPLLEAFFEWLHTLEDSVDRSSLIGEAVLYTLNQEIYLKRYLEDGHISIDNLAAERALKNFATGHRNWLFAKSVRGAQASATVYSITETAMLNGLKPYHYLTYVMEKMKDLGPFPDKAAMLELLPWSNRLPADCRSNIKK